MDDTDVMRGLRVLVVEDETIIGLAVAMVLEEWGHEVLGPFDSSAAALAELDRGRADFAILDIDLHGSDTSLPVARALDERGIPFLCMTGVASSAVRDRPELAGRVLLRKPVAEEDLREALETARATRDRARPAS